MLKSNRTKKLISDAAIQRLMVDLTAHELRDWCSANGVVRRRGANKIETAKMALDQKPWRVLEFLTDNPETETIPVASDRPDEELYQLFATHAGNRNWLVLDVTSGEAGVKYYSLGYF